MKSITLISFLLACAISIHAQEIIEVTKTGNLVRVRELIDSNPQLVNTKDSSGRTPLHWASSGVHFEVMQFLVARGADVNLKDLSGTTPLHSTATNNHLNACKLLIEKGAAVDEKNNRGSTPFYLAAYGGNRELLDYLIASGANKADLEIRNAYGRTPLCAIARDGGNPETIKVLLSLGADVNAEDKRGWTPIMLAAWRPYREVVSVLLEAGAELHVNTPKGKQLLAYAADFGIDNLFEKIMEKQSSIDFLNEDGGTLLHSAAGGGSARIVELLIAKGFDVNKKDRFDWVPLHIAAEQGHKEIISLLIKHGAEINSRNMIGQTPYNIAQDREDAGLMSLLKSYNADIAPPMFPDITGKYLGQSYPGTTAEKFGYGIIYHRYKPHSTVAVSPDGEEIFWNPMIMPRGGGYSYGYLMSTRIENGKWTLPEKVSFSEIEYRDNHPVFSADGGKLYFASRRATDKSSTSQPQERIWFVEKTTSGWSEPKLFELQPMPSVPSELFFTFSFDNAGNYYFVSGRDIYWSEFSNGRYLAPIKLGDNINTGELIGSPYISPNGDYLFYYKEKPYLSFRQIDGTWTKGIDIESKVGRTLNFSFSGSYIFTGFQSTKWISGQFIEELRPKEIEKDSLK